MTFNIFVLSQHIQFLVEMCYEAFLNIVCYIIMRFLDERKNK
jgi:hypothetical protein